jgi:hypothetical protein
MFDSRVEKQSTKRPTRSKSWRNLNVDSFIKPARRKKTGFTPPKRNSINNYLSIKEKNAVRKALLERKKMTTNSEATHPSKRPTNIVTTANDSSLASITSLPCPMSNDVHATSSISSISTPTATSKTTTATSFSTLTTTHSADVWNMKSVLHRQPGNSSILTTSRRIDPLLRIMGRNTEAREDLSDSLLVAAENGDAKLVDNLLRKGASADSRGSKGLEQFTALHYAACRGHLLVAERLIRAGGANVNAVNKDKETPLHLAVYGGYLNIVELLLDSGANVHAANAYNETPLFYAARRGFAVLTRLLMHRGADPDHKSRFGDTAIDDCSDGRVKKIISHWNLSKSNNSGGADGDGRNTLVGFSTGLLGKLPTRLLERICGMLDVQGLGLVAQIDGRCHLAIESKTLWDALGVSRWELAIRASVKNAAGGFEMVPFLANYRPSSSQTSNYSGSQPGSRHGSRPSSKDGNRNHLGEEDSTLFVSSSTKSSSKPTTKTLGFSMDIFLD